MAINPVEGKPNIAPAETVVIRRDRKASQEQQSTMQSMVDSAKSANSLRQTEIQQSNTRAAKVESQRFMERTDAMDKIQVKAEQKQVEMVKKNGGAGNNMDIFG